MKIKSTLLILILGILSLNKVHAVCNWKNRITAFTAYDSCKSNNTSKIGAYVVLNTNNGCIKYNWEVNGSKVSSSNQFTMAISKNGTYNICLKLLDSCNKCDTTICVSKSISCIKTCKWFMRSNYYYTWDSCNGKGYKSSLNGAYTNKACYQYTWKVNGSVVSNSSTLYYNVPKNGQYLVCLTVNDTCDKCDTTYCKTYNINCFTSSKCNWKSRNPYFYGWDTCKGKGYRNNVNAYISFNSNLNGCFKYNWTVNGKAAGTGNVMHYPIVENGTYNMCVKVIDTCNQCDTTFCMTKTISCFSKCNWKSRNPYIYGWDTCKGKGYRNNVNAYISFNSNLNGCFKYNWTVNGKAAGTGNVMHYPIVENGTYNMCVKVIDTCNQCDTTFCMTKTISCFTKCNWKSRNPYVYGWDTCKGKGYRNNVNAYISFNSNLNGCFKYNWIVNGKAAGTGNVMHYPIVENGTYNMCVKVIDTCNQCDTTFCMTKTISCFTKCNWTQKINGISYSDSCNGVRFRNSLGGKVLMNQNTSPGCYKYNWTLNGVNIGNTAQVLVPIYLNGKYNLCLKITDTCNRCDTSICRSFQYNCKNLGIADQSNNSLIIYPNPASEQINLSCENCEGGFTIYNSQGQEIHKGHFESMEMRIDVSKWSSGVYVLKRDDGSTSKILIE